MANEIRERFRERKFSYKNKRRKDKEKEQEQNIDSPIKLILFSPLLLIGVIGKGIDKFKGEDNKDSTEDFSLQKLKRNKEEEQNIDVVIRKSENILSDTKAKKNLQSNNLNFKVKSQDEYKYIFNKVNENTLEEKIFLKFKKELSRIKDECEIVESEEYILSKYNNDEELYIKAKEYNKKINILLEKLEKLNKEYKLFKNNNLIEEPLLLDNSLLIDDIIKYRESLEDGKINFLSKKYKLLGEYKYLYENLDNLIEKTENLKDISDKRANELKLRDENFNVTKEKMINLKDIEENCNLIINKNNTYLEDLSKKVNEISQKKYIESKLVGMNEFLSSSLRYIGLLSLTPLRGIIPGIAARTLASKKVLHQMYKNLHYEKKEKIVYSLHDYEYEINNKIYDIDNLNCNIDDALDDVKKIKNEFKDYFLQYNLDDYDKVYRKIELIEKSLIDNKNKVYLIKNNLIKNKKINKDNLIKVKKLNDNNY